MVVNYARTPDLLSQSHSIRDMGSHRPWRAGSTTRWFGGKIVLILSDGATIPTTVDTPEAKRLPAIIQAQAPNTILTGRWIKTVPQRHRSDALTLARSLMVPTLTQGMDGNHGVSLLFIGYARLVCISCWHPQRAPAAVDIADFLRSLCQAARRVDLIGRLRTHRASGK